MMETSLLCSKPDDNGNYNRRCQCLFIPKKEAVMRQCRAAAQAGTIYCGAHNMMKAGETDLGEGVYAMQFGQDIWLRTSRRIGGEDTICLSLATFAALLQFVEMKAKL